MGVPIYTIGYGNRSIQGFISILQRYQIKYLADIRSQPYSRYNSDFSKDALERKLKENHIGYIFLGDTLGGRPKDDSCYVDGRVDYSKLKEKPFYLQGIHRIHTAWEKQLAIALMCSEVKPQECHRGKLIGNTLVEHSIEVVHIDEKGKLKTQDEVNQLLLGEQLSAQPSLFGQDMQTSIVTMNEKINFSRKRYTTSNGFV